MARVVILGAGVSGLTTALELKKDNPEYEITVVAQHLPGDIDPDYTSPFAGANWHSFASHEDLYLQELDKPGYKRFLELASSEPTSGVWEQDNVSFVSNEDSRNMEVMKKETVPWFENYVNNFRVLEKKELLPGTKFGTSFRGVVVSVPTYLNFLVAKNREIGNVVRRIRKLKNINEALYLHESGRKADIVVNASGIIVNQLSGFEDPKKNYPVRGQVLLVRNNAKCQLSVEGFSGYDDEMLYMMPRKEGGTIIGGCFGVNNTDTTEDIGLVERTIERAVKYAPELIDPNFQHNPTEIEIVKVNIGLRPFREGGVRIEADSHLPWLIHNYGYGGGGYQGSYGGAEILKNIVRDILPRIESKSHL